MLLSSCSLTEIISPFAEIFLNSFQRVADDFFHLLFVSIFFSKKNVFPFINIFSPSFYLF